ncbi:MAG TPA: hypothetical protein VGK73_21105 [Polyangiaceae bacterium]
MTRSRLFGRFELAERPLRVACVCAALALFACASSSFDGRVFREDGMAFEVGPIPSAWRAIEVDGALLAFRDDRNSSTVALNGRCGLDGDDVPLEALTHHLFLHFRDRKLVRQERVKLDEREALRSELVAELDGVPMHYVVYVLKKNGCVYDFMHVSGAGDDSGREAFDRFVHGFGTLE